MTGKKAYLPKDMVVSKSETKEESVEIEDSAEYSDIAIESSTDGDEFDNDIAIESSTDDDEFDNDISQYTESVDDMENYMDLDDFVAYELRTLEC